MHLLSCSKLVLCKLALVSCIFRCSFKLFILFFCLSRSLSNLLWVWVLCLRRPGRWLSGKNIVHWTLYFSNMHFKIYTWFQEKPWTSISTMYSRTCVCSAAQNFYFVDCFLHTAFWDAVLTLFIFVKALIKSYCGSGYSEGHKDDFLARNLYMLDF